MGHSRFRQLAICSLLTVLGWTALGAQRATIPWQMDYAKAFGAAKQRGQSVFIDFYAQWCGPCRVMEETTFQDPDVVGVLRQMTCVRINVDAQPKVAAQYQASGIPRMVVLGPAQERALDIEGYADAEALLSMLASSAKQLGGLKMPSDAPAGAASAGGTSALIEALGNPQAARRKQASEQLRKLGAKAVASLLDALTHRLLAVRLGAWSTLGGVLRPPKRLKYDPWAPRAQREAQAKAVRAWAAGQPKAKPG